MERGSERRQSWLDGMVPREILGVELDEPAAADRRAVAVGIDHRGQTQWLWDRHAHGHAARATQRGARIRGR
jgi:hypothetical protein